MKVNILTNNSCPNSRAFNCPLLASKKLFRKSGYKLDFFFSKSDLIFEGDILFVNSNVFRGEWKKGEAFILKFLEKAADNKMKIFWFDTTDSTWCTQLDVLPYVDKFFKSQLYKDRSLYTKSFRTGRIFTDYFAELYKCEEREVSYPVAKSEDLHKLNLSWNTCFENYTRDRYRLKSRIKQKLRPFTSAFISEKLKIFFTSPSIKREGISCRLGYSHSRKSVVAHRKAVASEMNKKGVDCGKIPLDKYFLELENSIAGIGPFGVGEITLRDYEIIICGAALVKPDMSHLETWPNFFVPNRTFISHRWDLSDMGEKIDELICEPEKAKSIAEAAQKIYRESVSTEGLEFFVNRLCKAISE